MFKVEEAELKDTNIKKWYIRVEDKETGPYSYVEVCLLVDHKDLKPEEEVTYLGHGSWLKIKDCELFQLEYVRNFLEKNKISQDSEIPLRRSIRVPLAAELGIVVRGRMFKAQTVDMSSTGLMVKTLKSGINVNDTLKMHLYKSDAQKLPALNLKGLIVRKWDKSDAKFDYFGVNFEDMDSQMKEIIHQLIRQCILQGTSEHAVKEIFGLRIKGLDYGPSYRSA